jgi:hypothetical protein
MYTRKFSTGDPEFYLAYAGSQIYLYDVFQTDENTRALIQFYAGKQIFIEPKSRIGISTQNSITDATVGFLDPNMRDMYKYNDWKQFSVNVLKRKLLFLGGGSGYSSGHRG